MSDYKKSSSGGTVTDDDEVLRRIARHIRESANQIWLAGLGAYAKAEAEGSRLFDHLVQDGEQLDHETRKVVGVSIKHTKERVDRVRERASNSWCRFEKAFDRRLSDALGRLNIPSKQDIEYLEVQVDRLDSAVDKLSKLNDSK